MICVIKFPIGFEQIEKQSEAKKMDGKKENFKTECVSENACE